MFFLQIMHYIQLLVYNYIVSCSFSNVLYIVNAYIYLGKALIFLFCIARHLFQLSGIHFRHTLPGDIAKSSPSHSSVKRAALLFFTNIRFQQY